jgi:hypothetical protein
VAGEVAAREVRGRVGERRADEDPEQRGRVERVLDLRPQRERDGEEDGREAALDEQRHAQRVAAVQAARAAVGDRPREQLLDRPVDDRDDDEQHRPQQRDRAVLAGGSTWLATAK